MENVIMNLNPILSFHPLIKVTRQGNGDLFNNYSETYTVFFALTEHTHKKIDWVNITRLHNNETTILYDGRFVPQGESSPEGIGWKTIPGGLDEAKKFYVKHYEEKYSGSAYKMNIRFNDGSDKDFDLKMGPIQAL